jgi:nitrous oxidase accessory protein NosD
MGPDFSRVRFDPLRDYAGSDLQQGRVLLDADVNEQTAIVDRRLRALASDTLGRAKVSSTTPDGFEITLLAGMLQIGKGRLYVDGLLAENHGAASTDPSKRLFDDLLGETSFADPIRYDAQPYLPDPPALPTDGRHLVYLDVWNRAVTHLEQADLVENAVGIDTSARVQTVWQMRVLADDAGTDPTCASPDADVPGWSALIAPSTGVLSTGTFEVAPAEDPCELPPTGGYRGLENQLYRVEIHDAGQPGAGATFKWSRDRVGSRVASVISGSELEFETLGRDDVLRFNSGDWVEITDDVRELSQASGEMRRITVTEATRRIQFTPALPADMLPGSFPDSVFPRERHMRVFRWDQKGLVFRTDAGGTPVQVQDLDAPGSSGVIAVPAEGTTLLLENGVTVGFASTGAKGFRAGDYWWFAARTAEASVEILDRAPPYGIHHHYARLAFYTPPDQVEDCRDQPEHEEGACCCIVVQPGEDIQAALDALPAAGGCVCLKVGTHAIDRPLRIDRSNVVLMGESQGAVVRRTGGSAILEIGSATGVADVVIERLGLESAVGDEPESDSVFLLRMFASERVVIRGCRISAAFRFVGAAIEIGSGVDCAIEECVMTETLLGVSVSGDATGIRVQNCDIAVARRSREQDDGLIGVWIAGAFGPCQIANNKITGYLVGIGLNRFTDEGLPSSFAFGSRIIANEISRLAPPPDFDPLVPLFGIDVAAAACIVRDNRLSYGGSPFYGGIALYGDDCLAERNELECFAQPEGTTGLGILVGTFAAPVAFGDQATVQANRLIGPQVPIVVTGSMGVVVHANIVEPEPAGPLGAIILNGATGTAVAGNTVVGRHTGVFALQGHDNRVLDNRLSEGDHGIFASNEDGLEVCGNQISSMRATGFFFESRLDIDATRLASNRFRNCGFDAAHGIEGIAYAIHVASVADLAIEGCSIINTGISPDGNVRMQPARSIHAWCFGFAGAMIRGNQVATFAEMLQTDQEDRALFLLGPQAFVFGGETVKFGAAQILDNSFIGPGFSALVEVRLLGIDNTGLSFFFDRVTFSNNRCLHASRERNDQLVQATVSLAGDRVGVIGNHIQALPGYISFDLKKGTVFMGNVTSGDVRPSVGLVPEEYRSFNVIPP